MRKKNLFYSIMLICIFSYSSANSEENNYLIECKIDNYKDYKKAYLYDYSFGRYNLIDTAYVKNGSFSFQLNNSNHPGMYKIRISPDKVIENILFYYENISLTADYLRLNETLSYSQSKENILFLEYNNLINRQSQRERTLKYLLTFYDSNDKFYNDAQSELKRLSEVNRKNIQSIAYKEPNSLTAKYIKYEQIPFPESDSENISKQILIENFWNNIDFNDTILKYFPVYFSKIEDYFALFENPELGREEQEKLFEIPAEIILKLSSINETIFEYTAEKILNDTETFGLYSLYNFVSEKYLKESSCINEERATELKMKMEHINSLRVGNIAPDFPITSQLRLHDIMSDYILLIFWDSKCSYCFKNLHELITVYIENPKRNFEVVGVSIDTNSTDFKKSILERGYKWFNVCDFEGWFSPLVKEYNITATPTMFLLDRNKKIIARPVSTSQFLRRIKKAG